jgi:hypothetical protein
MKDTKGKFYAAVSEHAKIQLQKVNQKAQYQAPKTALQKVPAFPVDTKPAIEQTSPQPAIEQTSPLTIPMVLGYAKRISMKCQRPLPKSVDKTGNHKTSKR